MTILKTVLCNLELRIRLEHDEIGVIPSGDATFAALAAGQPRRAFCQPTCEVRQRQSPASGLGPHHGERQRKAGNASPGRLEVALAESLHLRRAGRMIRGHQINTLVLKPLPEFFAILQVADLLSD